MQGDSKLSTREELQFAVDHDKPIFLIKRCDAFKDDLTALYLPASMLHVLWEPYTLMPEDLVDSIVAKLDTIPPSTPRTAAESDPAAFKHLCVLSSRRSCLRHLAATTHPTPSSFSASVTGCQTSKPARQPEGPS
jgi:hypothetical protein